MRLNVRFMESDQCFCSDFWSVETLTASDYEKLLNRPSINSVVLSGALNGRDLGLGNVYYDTKENWDRQPQIVPARADIYIYSNASYLEDGAGNSTAIAGVKIGDGNSFLSDLPYITDAAGTAIIMHVANTDIHTSAAEKLFWNNKITAYMDANDPENLVLSRNPEPA